MSFRQFSHDGLSLQYRDIGHGLPVLFQHGLGGDEAQVAGVFPASPAVRRITLECRGQGGSPFGPPVQFSLATLTEDLAGLADILELGPAVVGGISMGAAIALRLAVLRPERLRALIIARPAWVAEAAPPNMKPYHLVGELMQHHPPAEARRRFAASDVAADLARLAPDNLGSLLGFFDRPAAETFGRLLCAIAKDGPGVSEAEIRGIDMPVLVIGHGHDLAHPEAMAKRLAGLIPGAELVRITPKAVDREAYADEFKAAIGRFLERLV